MEVEQEPMGNDQTLRSDARASRVRLLAAAKELVAEDGLDALTVVGVARRAGLNRSTAYQHFPQRTDLIDAVGAQFAHELRGLFSEPRELGEQIDFFSHHFRENPDIARIWMFHLLRDEEVVSQPGGTACSASRGANVLPSIWDSRYFGPGAAKAVTGISIRAPNTPSTISATM